MNARQKAKKYKKELDRLRSLPIKPQIVREERRVATIRATDMRDSTFIHIPEKMIRDSLLEKIFKSDEFRNAVVIESEYNEWTDTTRYTATLQVVCR